MRGVALDEEHGLIYWSDGKKIRRATLHGSNKTDIFETESIDTTYGLAVDSREGKLYISDSVVQKIFVTSLDGSWHTTLIHTTGEPRCLVVELKMRLLFYATQNPSAGVNKAKLDGSDIIRIVSIPNVPPFGIAIDYNTNRICWTGYTKKMMGCADYSGNQRHLYNTSGHSSGLAIRNSVAYYTQNTPSMVIAMQLPGGQRTSLNLGDGNTGIFHSVAIMLREEVSLGTTTRIGCVR